LSNLPARAEDGIKSVSEIGF